MQIANIQVFEGDGLPSLICSTCLSQVEAFFQFKSQVEKSDYFLRQQISNLQVDPLSTAVERPQQETIKSESPTKTGVVFIQEDIWNERAEPGTVSLTELQNFVRPEEVSSQNETSVPLCEAQEVTLIGKDIQDENKQIEDSDKDSFKPGSEEVSQKCTNSSETFLKFQENTEVNFREDNNFLDSEIKSNLRLINNKPSESSCVVNSIFERTDNIDLEGGSLIGKMKEILNIVNLNESKEEDEDNVLEEASTESANENEIAKPTTPKPFKTPRTADEKIEYCAECDKHFDKPVSLKKHKLVHTREKFTCSYCNKSFRQSWYLQSHVRTHTGERPFACSVCPKTFTDKGAMNAHVRVTHYTEKTHVCTYCNKAFKLRKQLERHERIHTGHQYHRCEICGKFYTQKSNLMKHLILHSGEKPFACPICEKRFAQKDNLNIHILRHHSQQNPIVCDACGKLFKNKMTLMGHKKSKHSDNAKQIICEVCGKFFPDRSCLNSHMWVHNAGAPVQCDQCGKSYPHERAVRVHKRIVHTEVRKYCCDVCGIGFKTSQTLKHHKVVHTGERAFSCEECGRSFGQKTALKTHQRIHSGIEPYSCVRCGESFKWKQTCDKHMTKCVGKRREPQPFLLGHPAM